MPELQSPPAASHAAEHADDPPTTPETSNAADAKSSPAPAASADPVVGKTASSKVTSAPPAMFFTGHHAYIVTVAKMCREQEKYTDVRIKCEDGELVAHRLVLASCSSFLRDVFLSLPQGLPEFTLMIPDIKKQVVATLIEFLYTGKMVLARRNTYDLQQLVYILKIDPENVRIESPDEHKKTRLVQTKMTSMIKLKTPSTATATTSSGNALKLSGHNSPALSASSSTTISGSAASMANTVVESKAMPLRATKRKLSQEGSSGSASPKEMKFASPVPSILPGPSSSFSADRVRGSLRRRGRPRPSTSSGGRHSSSESGLSGLHDLSNVNTWVCAICNEYDPVLPGKADPNQAANTEWIGCDCNRWYHQYCTGLKTVDETFCCSLVNLVCLPAEI